MSKVFWPRDSAIAAAGLALIASLAIVACEDGSVCGQGETQPCVCPAGATGEQVCSPDLQGWGACVCGGADGDADSDADDGDDADPDDDGGATPGSWVLVPAGTFTMGEPYMQMDDQEQHEVTLTHDFELRSTEVTQAEFEAAMGYDPSYFADCGEDCPVETVSWHEAAAYCNALSDAAGLDRCFECEGSGTAVTCSPAAPFASPYDCPGYRLPTEAEWEHAARDGETIDGNCFDSGYDYEEISWCGWNSGMTLHPVGRKLANARGLYDMLGNVWEWCHDWRGSLGADPVTDPWGPAQADGDGTRVLRGGSWGSSGVCWTDRSSYVPNARFDFVGFRPARTR